MRGAVSDGRPYRDLSALSAVPVGPVVWSAFLRQKKQGHFSENGEEVLVKDGKRPRLRRHSAEFRVEIAQRMLAGECVMALSKRYSLPRSMMYRWRDAYQHGGPAALSGAVGRRSGAAGPVAPAAKGDVEQRLRREVAELQRKVGQQAVEIDFFRRVFKRVEELPKANRRGGGASTPRSDE